MTTIDEILQGRKVIFTRASAIDTSTMTALDIMRAHIITYEALAMDEENQVKYKF